MRIKHNGQRRYVATRRVAESFFAWMAYTHGVFFPVVVPHVTYRRRRMATINY